MLTCTSYLKDFPTYDSADYDGDNELEDETADPRSSSSTSRAPKAISRPQVVSTPISDSQLDSALPSTSSSTSSLVSTPQTTSTTRTSIQRLPEIVASLRLTRPVRLDTLPVDEENSPSPDFVLPNEGLVREIPNEVESRRQILEENTKKVEKAALIARLLLKKAEDENSRY